MTHFAFQGFELCDKLVLAVISIVCDWPHGDSSRRIDFNIPLLLLGVLIMSASFSDVFESERA